MPRLFDSIEVVVFNSSDYRYRVMVTLDDTVVYKLYKDRKHLKTDPNYVIKFKNLAMELQHGYTNFSTDWITWDTELELPTEAEMYVKYGSLFMNAKFKEKGKEYENKGMYVCHLRKLFIDYGYYKSKNR